MLIYMDNCCFNRPFDDQSQIRIKLESEAKLFIQEKILLKKIRLAWSYILDYENQANPFDERKNIIEKWKKYAVIDIEKTVGIIDNAILIQKLGIKSKDALHVACAIESTCDYFLSTDDFLLDKLEGFDKVKAINPLQFITILEESR